MSQLDHIYDRINDDVEVINRIQTEESEVQKYYAGKTLFITGVTGFMGKCLLEKLLRSCPDLKHIYILLRERKNLTVSERLCKCLESDIFEPLWRQNPDFPKKITAIKGEIDSNNLGLQKDDEDILIKETDVIIHNAANVKFSERVHILLRVNVLGTKNLLDFACKCKNLESFMYVSTAFSHCYELDLEERLYPSSIDLKMVYHIIETDTKTENGLSPESIKTFLGKYPNTYTFTKGIAEDIIRQYSENSTFACGIFRPSVVMSTAKEPLVGWVDNINGAVFPIIGTGLGLVHTGYYVEHPFENVPCDMTINALLVVTSNLKKQSAIERGTVVYNYSSTMVNPISHLQIYNNIKNVVEPRQRFSKSIWLNFLIPTGNYWIFWLFHILWHFIPACLLDLVLLLLRKQPKAVSMFIKSSKNMDLIWHLLNTNWKVRVDKTFKVITQLNSVDKELFFCDLRELDWEVYCLYMWKGLKHYILKESLNNDKEARRYYLLWSLHYGLISMLLFTFTYYMIRVVV